MFCKRRTTRVWVGIVFFLLQIFYYYGGNHIDRKAQQCRHIERDQMVMNRDIELPSLASIWVWNIFIQTLSIESKLRLGILFLIPLRKLHHSFQVAVIARAYTKTFPQNGVLRQNLCRGKGVVVIQSSFIPFSNICDAGTLLHYIAFTVLI